jgi:hypothetical protein
MFLFTFCPICERNLFGSTTPMFSPPSQLLLPKPADNTSGRETTHGHSLGHGFYRRGAVANGKDAAHIGFVEWRLCLNDTLLVHTQSELLGEGSVGCGWRRRDLSQTMLEYSSQRHERSSSKSDLL